MNTPAPLSSSSQRALDAYGEATAAPLSREGHHDAFRRAVATATSRPRRGLEVLAFAASLAVGVAAVSYGLQLNRPAPARVEATRGTRFTETEVAVALESGSLHVIAHDVARQIVTAQLSVTVLNARVLVDVHDGATRLSVEEGSVVYRDGSGEHTARAGEKVRVPVELLPMTAAPAAGCESQHGAALDTCLGALAGGDGLAAETALYGLGLRAHEAHRLGDAVDRFHDYQRRFPDGAFAPEAAIAAMIDLRTLGQLVEARSEAEAFASRFPDEPRTADVKRWASQITVEKIQ